MTDVTRTALVTGGGQNIGRATVLALAERGFNVVINGHRKTDACEAVACEAEERGVQALVVMGNVGRAEVVHDLAEKALDRFGQVDVVINNAAIRPEKPFLETTEDDWHAVLDVDLNAAFYTSRAFLPGMVDRGWGRIVNITGMNAIHGHAGRAPVSAAKHGLWGLTKSLAKEFGPNNITVNAVSPGPIRSDNWEAEKTERHALQVAKIPLGRLGEPMHIAALCAFLVSDEGGFVTGQMIACNGGAQT